MHKGINKYTNDNQIHTLFMMMSAVFSDTQNPLEGVDAHGDGMRLSSKKGSSSSTLRIIR